MKKADKLFLIAALILVGAGFFIFTSAGTGLLAGNGARFSSVAFSQIFLGLLPGLFALWFFSRLNYKYLRRYSLFIFIAALILTILVFIPGIGFEHGGAKRWILVGGISFQPSEFLKIAFILYFAAWLSSIKEKVETIRFGTLPFVIFMSVIGIILLKQPDTDTLAVIFFAGLAMFITAGARWRDIFGLGFLSALAFVAVAFLKPYVMQRIITFLNPNADALGASYQIQQSLIAIGSGHIFGRGFGQSIQKFNFLPEPIGDSIFAVAAEEFGFIGSALLIITFALFALRGLRIASKASDSFGRFVVIGIITLIISQSFINIGAMLGIIPLSGITLSFVSHGGTALFFTLAEVGIVLSVSRGKRA